MTGFRLGGRLLLAVLLLSAAGCATWRGPRGESPEVRTLSPVPDVPAVHSTATEGILDAFFAANRIALEPQELATILPGGVVQERVGNPAALLRTARRHGRIAAFIPADAPNLWDALGRNLPLLLYLPADRPDGPPSQPVIPVRWDRRTGQLRLLYGDGILRDISVDRFFALREPLRHAALCLVKPSELDDLPLSRRERQLLLADYSFERGDYRRAEAIYRDLPPPSGTTDEKDTDADVRSLSGQAASLLRLGKPDRAIPIYEQALAIAPDNPTLLNNLAYAMMLAGTDLPEALRLARRALDFAPANPVFLETAGSLELSLGNPEAATRTLERAWSRASRSPPEVQVAIQDQLARAWLAADRRDLAWQVAEHRFRTFPDYAMPPDLTTAFPRLRRPRAAHPAP